MSKELFIKNMVCNRCIMAVGQILDKLAIPYSHITLGEVVTSEKLSVERQKQFESELIALGFELIDNRKSRIIEQIKNIIVKMVHHSEENIGINISDFIASKMNFEYNYLSTLFSEIEGTTIEKYYINQRIERVKELLVYDEFSLNEIAYQLGYSSTAYLSNQFKKVTGLTPSHFKKVKENKRRPLDKL